MVQLSFTKAGNLSWVFLNNNNKANANWYTKKCLNKLINIWKKSNPNIDISKMILHQDNARIHNCAITKKFLEKKKIKILRHPPYSPDLSPCDYYMFNKIKNKLKGKVFRSSHHLKLAWVSALKELTKNDFHTCFRMWFDQILNCIKNNGGY